MVQKFHPSDIYSKKHLSMNIDIFETYLLHRTIVLAKDRILSSRWFHCLPLATRKDCGKSLLPTKPEWRKCKYGISAKDRPLATAGSVDTNGTLRCRGSGVFAQSLESPGWPRAVMLLEFGRSLFAG
ncbi:hypothetical protein NPIL_140661 [Nephila pilipes]|uniref:Uncharacterized protein n=1 Tax=Nephila pilipes TaxID=299642 RepID=A0A8X6MZZ0_NEPPI|nr:hypothetical protein NPIL_140661 [Nephila pilipes]